MSDRIECSYNDWKLEYQACGTILCTSSIGRGMIIQNGDDGCVAYLAIYDGGSTQPKNSTNSNGDLQYTFEYTNGYIGGSCTESIKTRLTFICDTNAKPYDQNKMNCGQPINQNGVCEFEFNIYTYLACTGDNNNGDVQDNVNELSVGYIIIITFSGCLLLYCIIGMFLNYRKTKSVGIPNKDFWILMPRLVGVGCLVTFEWIKRKIVRDKDGNGETDVLVSNPTDE